MSKINQIDQPYTNKLKYLQILLIPLVLLGFELISFYISSTSFDSNTISLIYRSTFVLICFIIIFNCSFKKNILKQNYTLFGFWFLYLIRATYDSLLNTDISESMMFLFWTYSFFLCLIPMITLLASINVATINFAKKVFFFMAALVNVLSIINNFSAISLGLFSRYSSNIVLNSITYGQIGLALVIMSFSYFINSKKNRIIYILFFLLGLTNLIVAGSRGPILALVVVILFYIWANKRTIKFRFFIILSIIVFYFLTQINYFIQISNIVGRIESTNLDEQRFYLYTDAWTRFLNSPFLGNNAITEWAHNIFFGSLEVLGIIGGVLIFVIYRNAIKRSFLLVKLISTNWIALLLIMQLVSALVSGSIWNSIVLWPLLALTSNLYYNRDLYNDSII